LGLASLDSELNDLRFGGMRRLFGAPSAFRIQQAHIAVIGIGGVGSWAAEALARSGVKQITLIDMDHISESNINRQLHALSNTIGQSKVLAMCERIQLINPDCQVHMIDEFVTAENINTLLNDRLDLLIDASDQVSAKIALAAWAIQSGKPMVTVGAAGGKKMAHLVEIADLSDVTHDPLLAQVRQGLRKLQFQVAPKKTSGIHAVFSKEAIVRPDIDNEQVNSDNSLNCNGYGSLVTVTATFGQCAAGWALNYFSK